MKKKLLLNGLPASPGKSAGKVKLINSLKELKSAKPGDIIVTAFLVPDFVCSIKNSPKIAGIVTEKGGMTCHAAIVARELKIPYIAGAAGATKKLRKIKNISMDCFKGLIYES